MVADVHKFEFTDSMSEMGRIRKNWGQSHLGSMAFIGSSIPSYCFYIYSFDIPFPSLREVFHALSQHPVPLQQPKHSLSVA